MRIKLPLFLVTVNPDLIGVIPQGGKAALAAVACLWTYRQVRPATDQEIRFSVVAALFPEHFSEQVLRDAAQALVDAEMAQQTDTKFHLTSLGIDLLRVIQPELEF